MLFATAVDPQVPTTVANPIRDHIVEIAMGNRVVMNGIQMGTAVSANPIGVYETWSYPVSLIGSRQRQWHSFNLGEFLWAETLWSLVPLLSMLTLLFLFIVRSLPRVSDASRTYIR